MRKFEKLKTKIWAGLALLCAFSSPAVSHADDCCWDYDCNSACDWDWYVGAQYLYWKPCVNDLDYGSTGSDIFFFEEQNSQDVRRICPDWESGYRIYLGASSADGFGLFGSFTQVKGSASDTFEEPEVFIFPTNLHPFMAQIITALSGDEIAYVGADSYWDSDYRDWFIGGTYQLELNSCSHLTPYFGVAGLLYDEEFNTAFATVALDEEEFGPGFTFSNYSMDFKGVGLRLGSHFHSTICDCFGVYANMNWSLLVGDSDSISDFGFSDGLNEEEDSFLTYHDDGCCSLVPGCQLGLGVTYDACICDVDLMFKIGYEFNAWYNVPGYRFFAEGFTQILNEAEAEIDDVIANYGTSTLTSSRTIAYHGLTVGVGLKF